MRKAFNQELLKIAEKDPRVFMILADIGYGEIEPFANAFPDRRHHRHMSGQDRQIAQGPAHDDALGVTVKFQALGR